MAAELATLDLEVGLPRSAPDFTRIADLFTKDEIEDQ